MATSPYGLKNDYVTGAPPSASDLNRRANILRAQVAGALESAGEGVLPLPDETSLAVTYAGGAALVDIGAANVRTETGNLVFVENPAQAEAEDYVADAINYIFIVAYVSETVGVHDSETARLARLVASDTDSYPGGLLLATVAADGTVTMNPDRWGSAWAAALRLTQLESDLGYDETERAKGSVAERLNAMSEGGGDGGSGVVLWDTLKRSAVNPQTIAQFVGGEIEARMGGTGTNLLPPEVRDEVMVNTLHSLALHQMSVNNAFSNVPPFHAIVVSPGRGEGDWEYSDLTDPDLTTMPVNTTTHEFGSVG